jgi:hypothetical protein
MGAVQGRCQENDLNSQERDSQSIRKTKAKAQEGRSIREVSWVDDEFKERIVINNGLLALWNTIRDSIGAAVLEYNQRVYQTDAQLSMSDCTAKSRLCVRLEMKRKNRFIEVFIDENEQALSLCYQAAQACIEVCRYRANADRSGVELYVRKPDQTTDITNPEEACKIALYDFLFRPFPTPFATC